MAAHEDVETSTKHKTNHAKPQLRSWPEQAPKTVGTAQQSLLVGNFLSCKRSVHAEQGAHPCSKLHYNV
ncbi:hypothetical protein GRJ2_001172100 [Grus japonensis]|uniref:Uncharacterized protein n=1 Tax=Grus japonensis TaxID=30415 RepID=A0ABC9WNM6_GRUJA